jgi:hypothetical protein
VAVSELFDPTPYEQGRRKTARKKAEPPAPRQVHIGNGWGYVCLVKQGPGEYVHHVKYLMTKHGRIARADCGRAGRPLDVDMEHGSACPKCDASIAKKAVS